MTTMATPPGTSVVRKQEGKVREKDERKEDLMMSSQAQVTNKITSDQQLHTQAVGVFTETCEDEDAEEGVGIIISKNKLAS